jgi:hypothetical protein
MIYIDDLFEWGKRGSWCHMVTDGNLEELHTFAAKIGLKRCWYQSQSHPHYDLRPSKRDLAIKNGAETITGRQLVEIMLKKEKSKPWRRWISEMR